MLTHAFDFLMGLDAFFWGYIGFSLIIILGIQLTFETRFFQIRAFPSVFKTFFQEIFNSSSSERGLHPLKAFFASVGGMLGVGNIVGIVSAIQMGGPGALFWVWIAGFAGLSNCCGIQALGVFSTSSAAFVIAPFMPSAAGVSTSSAPIKRSSARRSTDIDSGIVRISL